MKLNKKLVAFIGRYDSYYMARVILRRDLLHWQPNLEMAQWLERNDVSVDGLVNVCLMLAPRDTHKTTIICARKIQDIVNNRDTSWLLYGETDINAKNKLDGEIKQHFEGNRRLTQLYGQFKGVGTWRDDRIIVHGRRRVSSQPTVGIAGVNAPEVGEHYPNIFINDPISNKNTGTQYLIEETNRKINLLEPIIEPGIKGHGGRMLIDGTRWADGDYYNQIIKRKKKMAAAGRREKYHIYIRTAVLPDGRLYFPAKLTKEFLLDKLDALGPYDFFCQYMNDPTNDLLRDFKEDWLVFHEDKDLTPEFVEKLTIFITIDPAYTEQRRNDISDTDYTGVIVNGVDFDGHWWILEAERHKVDMGGLFDLIFEKNEKWEPEAIGLEQRTTEGELVSQIKKEAAFLEKPEPPLVPYHQQMGVKGLAGNPKKENRIRIVLQNRFRRGWIHLNREQDALLYEYRRFPKAEHDDLLDALSRQPVVVGDEEQYRPGEPKKRLDKTKDWGLDDWVRDFGEEQITGKAEERQHDILGSEW